MAEPIRRRSGWERRHWLICLPFSDHAKCEAFGLRAFYYLSRPELGDETDIGKITRVGLSRAIGITIILRVRLFGIVQDDSNDLICSQRTESCFNCITWRSLCSDNQEYSVN
jgi:hypothetical protein